MGGDLAGVGVEVEETPQARDDGGERRNPGNADGCGEMVAPGDGAHLDDAGNAVELDAAPVMPGADRFDPRDRPRREEGDERIPVVGRREGELQSDAGGVGMRVPGRPFAPQRARRAMVGAAHGVVEAAKAGETRGERHLGHRERRLVDHLLGEEDAPRPRDRKRRYADVPVEQAPEMTATDPETPGQLLDAGAVERPVGDQGEGARYRARRAAPGGKFRRDLGPAAQTRPEPGRVRRRRAGQEQAVLDLRRARRANRPAVDTGAQDGGEEPSVEAGVAHQQRAVAGVTIEIHAGILARPAGKSRRIRTRRRRCRRSLAQESISPPPSDSRRRPAPRRSRRGSRGRRSSPACGIPRRRRSCSWCRAGSCPSASWAGA